MSFLRSILVVSALSIAAACFAKPPFLRTFNSTYKIDVASALGKARCLTCHEQPGPPKLNAYGQDVEKALEAAHARMVTSEMLKSIEKKDSDGDGFSNITEIKAGTLPGDKTSKPAKSRKAAKVEQHGSTPYGAALIPVGLAGLVWPKRKRA